MLYVVNNDLDLKYVEGLVSQYKHKFGMNIFSIHNINHFISWMYNEIMVQNFNLMRDSNDCMYIDNESPSSGVNDEEYQYLISRIREVFNKVGGIQSPKHVRQFVELLKSDMSFHYDEKFRIFMSVIIDELISDNFTDLETRCSIRDLCNTIQDRIEIYFDMY